MVAIAETVWLTSSLEYKMLLSRFGSLRVEDIIKSCSSSVAIAVPSGRRPCSLCGRLLVSAILPSGQRTLSPCYRPLVFTQFYTLALASWTVLSGRRPLSLGDRPLISAAVPSGRRPCSLCDRPLVFVAVPSGRRFPLNSTDAAVRRPHPV